MQINEYNLIVALPHRLKGVVPITEISDVITTAVERIANQQDNDDEEEDQEDIPSLPNLRQLFRIGQYLSCRVTALNDRENGSHGRDAIELSLRPEAVNGSVQKKDLTGGVVSFERIQRWITVVVIFLA